MNPRINAITNNTINIANNTLATEAAPSATPVNPNIAATIAMIKKVADHLSIVYKFKVFGKSIVKDCELRTYSMNFAFL